jgi:phosphoglycolate phosphatase-like HAD superfamily hydrolase
MTNHPMTPSPKIVDQLFMIEGSVEDRIIAAYKAGADQELEACCEWVRTTHFIDLDGHDALRNARRPKPPSLKDQALEALEALEGLPTPAGQVTANRLDTIRRALEAFAD